MDKPWVVVGGSWHDSVACCAGVINMGEVPVTIREAALSATLVGITFC